MLTKLNAFQKIFIVMIFFVSFVFNLILLNNTIIKNTTTTDLISIFSITFTVTFILSLLFQKAKIKNNYFIKSVNNFFYFFGLVFVFYGLSETLVCFLNSKSILLNSLSNLIAGFGIMVAVGLIGKLLMQRNNG